MRKVVTTLAVIALFISPIQASAAVKAGSACSKQGISAVSGSVKYTCVKSGKRLVWNKGVKVVAAKPIPKPAVTPAPTAAATPVATPTPTSTAPKTYNSLWEKYEWSKPTSADAVAQKATENFKSYTATIRNPNAQIKVVAQAGVDQTLITWVKDGANFVARTFAYPKLSREFVNVIAIDKTWLEETYAKEGYTAREIQDRVGGFNAGAPAFGGGTTNTWNYATIEREKLIERNKSGMAQTAGHEFFHAIQENLARTNPGPNGLLVPNWFWEGPSMFVGTQVTNSLGTVTYAESRQSSVDRYRNGAAINRSSTLEEIRGNDGVIDPYAMGHAASEFLAANVGMEKFLNIYAALGTGKSFAGAFKDATGVELADFYAMFEEIRGVIGFAKS